MELPVVIGIVVVAIVAAVLVVIGVRASRSRTERTDWLGELDEIRRSSLGDDEEVTGALEAVSVIEDDDDDEKRVEVEPEPEPRASEPARPAGEPTRTVSDAGSDFHEYDWPGFGLLRVEATEPRPTRIMIDTPTGTDDGSPQQLMVDLPRGVLWFRSDPKGAGSACSVRTVGGWALARGDLLILVGDDDSSYVMCLEGAVTLRSDAGSDRSAMTTGQIARLRPGIATHDIVDVGLAALETDGVVRRQRRLDGQTEGDRGHE